MSFQSPLMTGPKSVKCKCRYRYSVVCDKAFVVYGLRDGKRKVVLGPHRVDELRVSFVLPNSCNGFEVDTGDIAHWSWYSSESDPEELDPRPVAFPVSDAPVSLSDQVRELVQVHLSNQAAKQGMETEEEADDFEVPDEEPEISSPYEFVELQDDFVPEPESTEPPAAEEAQESRESPEPGPEDPEPPKEPSERS